MAIDVTGWALTAVGEPMQELTLPAQEPAPGEALVEVAGCGVCHTDVSFLYQGVKTRHAPPLILGHEVSGTVRAVGAGVDPALLGRPVLVPAVLPCGECALCRAGHRTICRSQVMPGNDRHGGFATHLTVPARWICPIEPAVLATHDLWELSVVADAVTTPFMAVKRSGLAAGDLAVVIGAGGIGIHAVQIAAATGATVIALDVDPAKLEQARAAGAAAALDVRGRPTKDVRQAVRDEARRLAAPDCRWRLYETSGTRPGQETGFALLNYGASLSIVGFTMDTLEVRLSNLMAFDAQLLGNWGCDPALYPEVLQWLAAGRIQVRPFVERHPLAEANAVLAAAHHGQLTRRAVLVP